MEVAATITLRNGPLVRWRLDNGYTQKQAAEYLGVISQALWCRLENFRFGGIGYEKIARLADAIGCRVEDICPEEFMGRNFDLKYTHFRKMKFDRMLGVTAESKDQLMLPEEVAQSSELMQSVRDIVDELPSRIADVVRMKFGIAPYTREYTLKEVGKKHGVTKERVRQIVLRGMREVEKRAAPIVA